MVLSSELLQTLAQSAVAYAGLSALSLVVIQLAGVQWQAQMTTGLWLIIAWSLGAFVFSIAPLTLVEFGIETTAVVSITSAAMALFVLAVIVSALRRDIRLIASGATGAARPPVATMVAMGTICVSLAVALLLNAFALLPGSPQAWYVLGVCMLLLFAIVPLAHIVAAVRTKE